MSTMQKNPNTVNTKALSPRMIAALQVAADRWDHAITSDRRTWGALYQRGLVDVLRGRGTGRYGETTYNVITGVYINEAGLGFIEQLKETP